MRNTIEFAEYVKNARGARTQDQIDGLGGPVRQTQSRIENAEPFEITGDMLDKLDRAHQMAPGFFAALLRTGHLVSPEFRGLRYCDAKSTPIVGYQAQTYLPREFPRRLQMITRPFGFFPLLGILGIPGFGTVLIDVAALDGRELPELLEKWERQHTGSTVWTTVPELGRLGGFQPLIIDPLSSITTLGQARDLVHRIIDLTLVSSHNDVEDLAVTVALTAYLAKSQSITTYEVLELFIEIQNVIRSGNEAFRDALARFFSPGQLPATYRRPNPDVHQLLGHLQRLKTAFTHLEFTDPAAPPNVVCPPVTDFAALASGGPALIIYDGQKTPEMPALIARGLANTPGHAAGELIIIAPTAVYGVEPQDAYVVAARDVQSPERKWQDQGYAELKVMAVAYTDKGRDEAPQPLYRSFLGVLTTDDRSSAMPIFLPGE